MKLLLDEHFSPEIARQLQRLGHDVLTARDLPTGRGATDAELLSLATAQGRAIVTENVVDFIELHRAAVVTGRRHAGLIFTSPRRFPRTKRAMGRLILALDALLVAYPGDGQLDSQTLWLG